MLATNYEGTLKQLATIGYQEVEAAGFYGKTAQQVKQAMQAAALHCVSAHYSLNDLNPNLEKTIEFGHELGLSYLICSFPGFKDPSRVKDKSYQGQVKAFQIDDYRWNAEQFNRIGQKVKDAGMQFGYHNHTMEFHAQNGIVPFDELLRLTDPALVTIEMDCGWVKVGGANPADLLRRYPSRISMLHVKDFKPVDKSASAEGPPPAAQLGQGTIDYRAIFEAAKKGSIKHYFVEQEGYDIPPMQALKIDAEYMKNLEV